MVFSTPFIAYQSELYALLTNADEMADLKFFDSESSIDEILESLDQQEIVQFGVISDISCIQNHTKTDAPFWNVTTRLELFSNYKGRLRVAEMINLIGVVATKYEEVFKHNLIGKGYYMQRMNIGESVIGSAISDGHTVWQNGYITINALLEQIEEE